MSSKKKLVAALQGFSPYALGPNEHIFAFRNVSTGNLDPPAYIVAFLFLSVLDYTNHGRSEKVWWHTFFEYRGFAFMLRDYKFGSWSLETRATESVPDEIVRQVVAKIQSASRHADELLSLEIKKQITDERFWIHNGYSALRSAFDFYLGELRQAVSDLDAASKSHEGGHVTKNPGVHWAEAVRLENVVSYRAFPLFVSFFSLLEFLFDVLYAFQRPSMSFLEFRSKSWDERFKLLISLPPGTVQLRLYERIRRIKSLFRNPLTHGLTNESSLLVPVPFGGLVPATYEHLESSVHFGTSAITRQAALDAIETFTQLIDFLWEELPFAFAMKYIEYGFSIPVESTAISEIQSEMTDIESFAEYLDHRAAYQDALMNRDI